MPTEREWVDPETGWAYRVVTRWAVKRLQCRNQNHGGWFDCSAAEGHESGLRWFLSVVDEGSKGDDQ